MQPTEVRQHFFARLEEQVVRVRELDVAVDQRVQCIRQEALHGALRPDRHVNRRSYLPVPEGDCRRTAPIESLQDLEDQSWLAHVKPTIILL